jgi:hypothetical protein
MRRTFYGWRQSARAPIISNDSSQPQSRAVASGGVTSNNDTSVHRSIEQQPAAKRSRMNFEDDDNGDLHTSGFGDIDWPERDSIIVKLHPSIILHHVLFSTRVLILIVSLGC